MMHKIGTCAEVRERVRCISLIPRVHVPHLLLATRMGRQRWSLINIVIINPPLVSTPYYRHLASTVLLFIIIYLNPLSHKRHDYMTIPTAPMASPSAPAPTVFTAFHAPAVDVAEGVTDPAPAAPVSSPPAMLP